MKIHSNYLKSTLAILGSLLAIGCSSDLNNGAIRPFDKNGVMSSAYIADFYSIDKPANIKFYIESSGSMNGLFRKNKSTAFKHDISAILLNKQIKARLSGVNVFDNSGSNVLEYDPQIFRDKMNKGDFVSQSSTIVPNMLDRIISDIKDEICDVAVFISDMKYSPEGATYAVAMNQYKLDVADKFSRIPDLAVSVIGCESNFVAANGIDQSTAFPYYLTIIGRSPRVAWLRNEICATLSDSEYLQGCLDFNIDYGCPNYTALPYTCLNMVQNYHELALATAHSSSFTTFDDSIQPAEIVLAVNFRHIPIDILSTLSDSDFKISSHYHDIKARIIEILPATDFKPTSNQKQVTAVNPNLYLRLSISGLKRYDEEALSIQLTRNAPNKTWIEKYYGARAEGELNKTLSIDGFIGGLEKVYSGTYLLQNKPMYLFITKK